MSRRIVMLVSLLVGCSGPSDDGSARDRDVGPDAVDVGSESVDAEPDTAQVDMSWRQCPRGSYPSDGECSGLAGCSGFALTREELGCVFFPDTMGRLTEAECETDSDCAGSPYGPNCILRVCHVAEPCESDEDCGGGTVCINFAACMPPPPPCQTDDECTEPAFCFEGSCF